MKTNLKEVRNKIKQNQREVTKLKGRLNTELSEILTEIIYSSGISCTDIAEHMGYSRQYINGAMRGRLKISYSLFERIYKAVEEMS
jgi:transcriptional regulator with XRE-family HTH domain